MEAAHEKRYLKILDTLKKELTFKGDAPLWMEMPPVRIHPRRRGSAGSMPDMRISQSVFREKSGKIIRSGCGRIKAGNADGFTSSAFPLTVQAGILRNQVRKKLTKPA